MEIFENHKTNWQLIHYTPIVFFIDTKFQIFPLKVLFSHTSTQVILIVICFCVDALKLSNFFK